MNENQLETNQKCYIDWEKLNQEFDELRQNEVEVAKRKTVQKVVQKAVQKAVEKATKETEERVRAEAQLKLVEEKEKSKEEGSLLKSIEIAKKMIAANMDKSVISNMTGLTIEELKELKSGDKHE